MLVTLARDNSGRCVGLHLPAEPADIAAAYEKLDAVCTDERQTRIFRAETGVGSLDRWLRDRKMDRPGDYVELGELAVKIDAMTEQERKTFDGALTGAAFESVDEVLRIADSLDEYIFINGVTTEKELGRFLVDSGYKGFPESVKPYLDYAAIGTEYYAERGGAFGGDGYTLRRSSAEPMVAEHGQNAAFRVYLRTQGMRELGLPPRMLMLPASDQEAREIKSILNIEDFAEAAIVSVSCMDDALAKVLPTDLMDVDLLDQFADQYADAVADGEREKCLAVLEIEKPSALDAAASLLINLEHYTLLPDDAEAYGKEALTRAGATDELMAEIDGFMDYEAYGTSWMLMELGVDSYVVLGRADGGGHAWNKVCLNGRWYNVDACWDDTGRSLHRYCLKSDDWMMDREHSFTDSFSLTIFQSAESCAISSGSSGKIIIEI